MMPSALDELLAQLDLHGLRCTVERTGASISIQREGGMLAVVRDAGSGLVEIIYEQAPHVPAREVCRPGIGAQLLRLIFSRTQLEYVHVPTV